MPLCLSEFNAEDIAPCFGDSASLILQTANLPIQAFPTGLMDVLIPVPYGVLDCLDIDSDAINAFLPSSIIVLFFHMYLK